MGLLPTSTFQKVWRKTRWCYTTNAAGEVLASYSNKAKERSKKLTLDKGANTFVWDTRGTGAERLEGMILWWANLDGPKAVPGAYKVSMSVGDQTIATHDFSILPDPRAEASVADMQAQYDFISKVNTTINDAHDAIKNIRDVNTKLSVFMKKYKGDTAVSD